MAAYFPDANTQVECSITFVLVFSKFCVGILVGKPDILFGTPDLLVGTPDILFGTPDILVGTSDILFGTPDILIGTPDILTAVFRPFVSNSSKHDMLSERIRASLNMTQINQFSHNIPSA